MEREWPGSTAKRPPFTPGPATVQRGPAGPGGLVLTTSYAECPVTFAPAAVLPVIRTW